MSTPTFAVLIGSIGRSTLPRALDSMAAQMLPGDQVIVAFDAYEQTHGDIDARINLVRSYGAGFMATATVGINRSAYDKVIPAAYHPSGRDHLVKVGDPYHWLGVEQINYALRTLPITASHIFTIGDDDVFVPGAYEKIREVCAAHPSQPVFYRFLSPARDLLWDKPRLRSCLISGCCIAAPAEFVPLHPTDIETTHDFRWMTAIVEEARSHGYPPVWLDYLGVVARPSGTVEEMTVPICSGEIVAEVEQEP